MSKFLIALTAFLWLLLPEGAACAGQGISSISTGGIMAKAADIMPREGGSPVLLAAGKEWNEDQRSVVRSFQSRSYSTDPNIYKYIFFAAGFMLLLIIINILRKRF